MLPLEGKALAPLVTLFGLLITVSGAVAQDVALKTVQSPGVMLLYAQDVDETYPAPIADVVSVAKQTIEGLFPDLAKEEIRVYVNPAGGWYESTVTDRRDSIYVHLGQKGIGEHFRADAGPVGILCQAVAELYNPQRLPGLDRYLAHRHLVPAVLDKLGLGILPEPNPGALAEDGEPMVELMTDGAYTPVHPDFAAVAALAAIEDALTLDGLKALLAAARDTTGDQFRALRDLAIEQQADLEEAFQPYDEATDIPLQEDGTCLIASFEADEIVSRVGSRPLSAFHDPLVLMLSNEFEMSQTDEWATDGEMSLKLHAKRPRPYINMAIADPDWRYKDWRGFGEFQMDLRFEGKSKQALSVRLYDDIGIGHKTVYLFWGTLEPGEVRQIRCRLDPRRMQGRRSPQADYTDGPFRAGEVAMLIIVLHDADPAAPVTLHVDNIRVRPMVLHTGHPKG